MQIAHIFNEVKPKDKTKSYNNEFIDTQPFDMEYWKKSREDYKPKDIDSLKDDFSKKYYYSLYPQEGEDETISKYDYDKIKRLTSDEELGNDLLLISGDFWGIQKFIFDGITTSKASKILRSRSAMVQLITYAIVKEIQYRFKGSEVLLFGAGKFTILAKREDSYINKIEKLQKELDSYFLQKLFGQNGFILSAIKISKDILITSKENKLEREKILDDLGKINETNKLNKFNLLENNDILINPFKNSEPTDSNSCKFCNKRIAKDKYKIEDENCCDFCFNQINLGKHLVMNDYINVIGFGRKAKDKSIDKNLIKIMEIGTRHYYARFSKYENHFSWGDSFNISAQKPYKKLPKWSLNSYVYKENNEIKDFSTLAQDSSGLMALKADIDKLGDSFRKFYIEDFKKFNRLSREVDFFFSDYITSLLKEKKIYTVFAGGDDLFLIGEYKEIIKVARTIRDEFYTFSLNKTTISMGLVMFKPTTPINFVSEMADKAEKRAKSVLKDEDRDKTPKEISENSLDRDGIDIFGISMKFDEFIDIEDSFEEISSFFEKNRLDTTAFYYRLISFCDMRANLKHRDKDEEIKLENAMWKSKLNYSFRRNVYYRVKDEGLKEESLLIQKSIHSLIDKYDEKFKPSLFLKIYKNRDEKKENRDD